MTERMVVGAESPDKDSHRRAIFRRSWTSTPSLPLWYLARSSPTFGILRSRLLGLVTRMPPPISASVCPARNMAPFIYIFAAFMESVSGSITPESVARGQSGRACHKAVKGFCIYAHVDEFILNMRLVGDAVVIGHSHSRSDGKIDVTAPAGRGGETLEIGEAMNKVRSRLPFAAKENPLPGDKDVIKEDVGALMHAECRIADIFSLHGHELCVGTRGIVHMNNAFRVSRNGKGDGVSLIVRTKGRRRHHEPFMGNGRAGLLELRPIDDDAVAGALNDPDIKIGIRLTVRRQGAVALGVRNVAGDRQVIFLAHGHVFFESLMVVRLAPCLPYPHRASLTRAH